MSSITASKYIQITETPISILLLGGYVDCNAYIDQLVKSLSINLEDIRRVSPDDSKGKTQITSIEQVRDAQHFISTTPIGQNKMLIFNSASSLPPAAANALLKTLEEPPRYAAIVLCAENDNLMPTIISRCRVINLWSGKAEVAQEYDFDEILSRPFYAQSQLVEETVKDAKVKLFLESFERWARERLIKNKKSKEVKLIKEIIRAKRDIRSNVSARLVLESLIIRYINNV